MNKQELINTIRQAVTGKYSKEDGKLDYTAIFKETGIQPNQVKAFFDTAKNPGINLIFTLCNATGLKLHVNYF